MDFRKQKQLLTILNPFKHKIEIIIKYFKIFIHHPFRLQLCNKYSIHTFYRSATMLRMSDYILMTTKNVHAMPLPPQYNTNTHRFTMKLTRNGR